MVAACADLKVVSVVTQNPGPRAKAVPASNSEVNVAALHARVPCHATKISRAAARRVTGPSAHAGAARRSTMLKSSQASALAHHPTRKCSAESLFARQVEQFSKGTYTMCAKYPRGAFDVFP